MRLIGRLILVVAIQLGVGGCGQPDPVAMPVSMPECIYQGPDSMDAGNARVSLNLNGITDSGVALVRLQPGHGFTELNDHLAHNEGLWTSAPGWATPVLDLRLDTAEGRDGVEDTTRLEAGTYAVVCLTYPLDEGDPIATLAAEVTVREG